MFKHVARVTLYQPGLVKRNPGYNAPRPVVVILAERNKMQILNLLLILIISVLIISCTSDHSAESVAAGRTEAQLAFLCANIDQYQVENGGRHFTISNDDKDFQKKQKTLFDGWKRKIVPILKNRVVLGAKSFGSNGIDDNGKGDDLICAKP
jgi:hypothetical protein